MGGVGGTSQCRIRRSLHTSPAPIAHRGLSGTKTTENTVHSFVVAYQRGARNLETDLQLTADHQWVLMHDATINRTTYGTGAVASKSFGPDQEGIQPMTAFSGGFPASCR